MSGVRPYRSRAGAWLLTAALLHGLAGCASVSVAQKVSQARADLSARSPSSERWADLRHQPLPLKPETIELDATSEVFVIDGQKVYVSVFELPQFSSPYSVMLTSMPSGAMLESALLVPRVLMLDDTFKVTRSFTETGLRTRGSKLERTVFLNPGNARERWMVVYGSALDSSFVRDVQLITTQTIGVGSGFVNWQDGKDAKETVRSSPVGSVRIEVDGLAPTNR